MKKCRKCSIEKHELDFHAKDKRKGTLQLICKICQKEVDRIAYSENKHNRKSKIINNTLLQKKKARDFTIRIKKLGKCNKCMDNRWYVLDFHHIREKKWDISELVSNGSSIKRLKEEMRKCILLCSNCHREEHYLKGEEANQVKASD